MVYQELNEFKKKNYELGLLNSQLEEKLREIEEKNEEFENIKDEIENDKSGLIVDESNIIDNSRLENIKHILEEKCIDLRGLSNLSNEDLKNKIISMKKILDLLYNQFEKSDHKKLEYENKLIKLQSSFNDQLEEDKKEILRLYKKSKKFKDKSFLSPNLNKSRNNNNLSLNLKDSFIINKNDKLSLLRYENKSLKAAIKDLKKKVSELKTKNSD